MNIDKHFICHRKEVATSKTTALYKKKHCRKEVRYQCMDNNACTYQKVRNTSFSENIE